MTTLVARLLVTVALLFGAGAAVLRFCVAPLFASHQLKVIETRTLGVYRSQDPELFIRTIRDNVRRSRTVQSEYPVSIDGYMDEAANWMLMRRYPEAVDAYKRGLAFDRRPEMYLNVGYAYAALGNDVAAIDNFVYAIRFNPLMADDIDSDDLRTRAVAIYRREELGQ